MTAHAEAAPTARQEIAEYLCDRDRLGYGPGLTWRDFTEDADDILAIVVGLAVPPDPKRPQIHFYVDDPRWGDRP